MSTSSARPAAWPCATCSVHDQGFCRAFDDRRTDPEQWQNAVKKTFRSVRAQRQIFTQSERSSDLYILRYGWVIRSLRLPDGVRQIISIALPGDLLSHEALFGHAHVLSAEALTESQICRLDSADLKRIAFGKPGFFEVLCQALLLEEKRTYHHLADISMRSAKQRIASMILDIANRLKQRNIIRGERYHFPLRQRHIAELLGMTSVHVSRVMGELQNDKIVALNGVQLQILDRAALDDIVQLRV